MLALLLGRRSAKLGRIHVLHWTVVRHWRGVRRQQPQYGPVRLGFPGLQGLAQPIDDRGDVARADIGAPTTTRRPDRRHVHEVTFDQLQRIRAPLLYVLSRTDRLFPPAIAPKVLERLHAAGVRTRYFEIDSEHGHFASSIDAAKWAPTLRAFLK